MLQITACCNSGILLEYDGYSILLDGISADYCGFSGLSSELFSEILQKKAPFENLCGFFFSHDHPDHFDGDRLPILKSIYRNACFFVPQDKKTEFARIQCGPFDVLYYGMPHMPLGLPATTHGVFLIQAGQHCIYFMADAIADPALHAGAIGAYRPDCIFANFLHLTSEPMVDWFSKMEPKQLFIMHLPAGNTSRNGYRKKAERCMQRVQNRLPQILLIDRYPMPLL